MAEIQLKAAFEKESKLFLSEFQKPDCFRSTNCIEYVREVMNRHSEVLFANCIKNYIHLCLLNYFSALYLVQNATSKANKSFIKLPLDADILEEIKNDIVEFIVSFYT